MKQILTEEELIDNKVYLVEYYDGLEKAGDEKHWKEMTWVKTFGYFSHPDNDVNYQWAMSVFELPF